MGEGLPTWLQVIYAALVPLVVAMLIGAWQQRQAHKAAGPKDESERDALETRVQGETLDRIAKENARLSERVESLATAAEKAQAAADKASDLARKQGVDIADLKQKQASAIRFIAKLITEWPQTVAIPTIPEDLAADVAPHIKRPKWAADT